MGSEGVLILLMLRFTVEERTATRSVNADDQKPNIRPAESDTAAEESGGGGGEADGHAFCEDAGGAAAKAVHVCRRQKLRTHPRELQERWPDGGGCAVGAGQ